jgi:hypothetical protein
MYLQQEVEMAVLQIKQEVFQAMVAALVLLWAEMVPQVAVVAFLMAEEVAGFLEVEEAVSQVEVVAFQMAGEVTVFLTVEEAVSQVEAVAFLAVEVVFPVVELAAFPVAEAAAFQVDHPHQAQVNHGETIILFVNNQTSLSSTGS